MQDAPRPAALARVPPHNLRAEESVLGAMMLSREAIADVVEILEPDHFYKPAHGHLFDAVMSLYSAGEPVDAVTVAEELKRAGLLEEIGGPAVLLDFQATTPAISNASYYAKIVEEHALLRRMIYISNEIAETAYGIPEDVPKAVDDAEAKMFDVAQHRVTNTTAAIRDLLPANLDRIEMLYDRGEAITGLSTGYLDLDEKLAGLQPNSLYVVGARPAMGKALALDTPIVTPDGWSTMGDLSVGDAVFAEDGQPCRVTYKSPVFAAHDCYDVEFDDGSVIVADAEHQWFTSAWAAGSVGPACRTTRELAATLWFGAEQRANHRVPVAAALECPEAELPLDPYLFGVWLGAGHAGRPLLTTADSELVEAFALGGWTLSQKHDEGPVSTYSIHRSGDPAGHGLALGQLLESAGVSRQKSLPPVYLRSSIKQRLALLQGVMDTRGTVLTDGSTCQLSLSDENLLGTIREIVLSLGFKAALVRRSSECPRHDEWRFTFSPPESVFRLARNVSAQHPVDHPDAAPRWRTIVDVRPVESVATQCISVDGPSHLYLAGTEMIPTHNTAFALGMAANSAMHDRRPVLIFTLEMGQLELSQRLLCSEALVDSGRVKTGRLDEAEWTRISHAVGRLAETPIFIDDNPHTSVMDIRAKARRLKSREGDLGMIVVDYIQLMTGRSNAESRQVEVSEISRNLKILARELEAPVIALAQLNRSLEQRTDKRPMLSDLRESGSLEQDADVVMFLYRDEVYDDQSPDKGVAEVIIAKNRNGPVGKARLAFRGQFTRFDNMARSIPPGPDQGGAPGGGDPGPDF